jgi:hypothetical protein
MPGAALCLEAQEGPDIRLMLFAPAALVQPGLQLGHGDSSHCRSFVLVSPARDESMTKAWQGHEIAGQKPDMVRK